MMRSAGSPQGQRLQSEARDGSDYRPGGRCAPAGFWRLCAPTARQARARRHGARGASGGGGNYIAHGVKWLAYMRRC